MHFSFLLSPLGWVVLGAAGYVIYRVGKKSGEKAAEKAVEKAS